MARKQKAIRREKHLSLDMRNSLDLKMEESLGGNAPKKKRKERKNTLSQNYLDPKMRESLEKKGAQENRKETGK